MITRMKEEVIRGLDNIREELVTVSDRIHQQPELGFQEFFAMETLTEALGRGGFRVEKGVAGLETAFYAEFPGKGTGPKIAFLAEYDALPELGHGCGHNIIGSAAIGAALAVSWLLDRLDGTVAVIGCPAEETGGGKLVLIEQGYFRDVAAAMMVHPADRYAVDVTSLALDAWEFNFTGKA
ncbi:MAG TPA: M20/M25/M40 family metallo-hydrolase, partial [Bacillota bacterium]|nr:M20/M25/M40 family metallo-hydrolase [Bacillota bacterium]